MLLQPPNIIPNILNVQPVIRPADPVPLVERNMAPIIRLTMLPAFNPPEHDPLLEKMMYPSTSLREVKLMAAWRQNTIDAKVDAAFISIKAKKALKQLQEGRRFSNTFDQSVDTSKGTEWMVSAIEGMIQTRLNPDRQAGWSRALALSTAMTHMYNDMVRRRLAAPHPIDMVLEQNRNLVSLVVINAWAMMQWMDYWDIVSQTRLANLIGVNAGPNPDQLDKTSLLYKDYLKFALLKSSLLAKGEAMLRRGGDPRV